MSRGVRGFFSGGAGRRNSVGEVEDGGGNVNGSSRSRNAVDSMGVRGQRSSERRLSNGSLVDEDDAVEHLQMMGREELIKLLREQMTFVIKPLQEKVDRSIQGQQKLETMMKRLETSQNKANRLLDQLSVSGNSGDRLMPIAGIGR